MLFLWPAVAKLGAVLLLLWPMLSFAVIIFLRKNDVRRKTVAVIYEDTPTKDAFDRSLEGFQAVARSKRIWRVISSTDVRDTKHNAGASRHIVRWKAESGVGLPPYVDSNIRVPFIKGSKALYFFPDVVLVLDRRGFVRLPYEEITIGAGSTLFIESGLYPKDAPVVDHTWQVVNKSGGPDKRVKDNRQLPVLRYDTLGIHASDTINDQFHISAPGSAKRLAGSIDMLRLASAHRASAATHHHETPLDRAIPST